MRRRTAIRALLVAAAASTIGLAPSPARAGEKQFGYIYEPQTLPEGAVELEQWVTPRLGKAGGVFSELDTRTEIEVGLIDDLQTSLYLNLSSTRVADARSGHRSQGFITNDAGNQKFSEFSFDGISNEWIYKLSDPVADPIGFAAYVELETNGAEFEIEEKLLFAKTWGPLTVAANFIFEQDWRTGQTGEPTRAVRFNFVAGAAYKVPKTPFGFGLEFRNENTLDFYTKYDHAVFSIGPNVHYYTKRWWATLTVLPQIASPTRTYKSFDYDAYEVLEARLIIGIEF